MSSARVNLAPSARTLIARSHMCLISALPEAGTEAKPTSATTRPAYTIALPKIFMNLHSFLSAAMGSAFTALRAGM
jgi:hypothetical protein